MRKDHQHWRGSQTRVFQVWVILLSDIHLCLMTDIILIKNAIVVSAGVVFGFAFERALVHIPTSITQQFLFSRWIMMKFFLSAMAKSLVVMIFSKATSSHFENARNKRPPQSTASIVLGSLLTGVGMAFSGLVLELRSFKLEPEFQMRSTLFLELLLEDLHFHMLSST
jgi:hypothetical protein